MPWMIEYANLDAEQRDFVDNINQSPNMWLNGYVGAGKSIVLLYSLVQVKRDYASSGIKVCLVLFTHSLIDMFRAGIQEIDDNNSDLENVAILTYHQFKNQYEHSNVLFDYIFVDEVQDLPEDILKLLSKHCKKLIMAGDPEQSIYSEGIDPSQKC